MTISSILRCCLITETVMNSAKSSRKPLMRIFRCESTGRHKDKHQTALSA